MGKFPTSSTLYLDDDAFVRSDGIHEPRKEKLKTLVHKIRLAWRAQAYDEVEKLLVEYKRLRSPLAEFEEMCRELPIRQHINRLKKAKKSAENDYQAGLYSQAHKALLEIGVAPPIPAGIAGLDEINLLTALVLDLRQKVERAWVSFVKQAIEKQIALGTKASLEQARQMLGLLSELPLEHAAWLSLEKELREKIQNAEFIRAVGLMREAFRLRSWTQAIECAQAVLHMDQNCEEAKEISSAATTAIWKRRLILAAAACLVVLIVTGAIKAHRNQMCKDFWSALAAGQYGVALNQAHRIRSYDDQAAAYILFSEKLDKFKDIQKTVLALPGIKATPRWDERTLVAAKIDQQLWLAGPSEAESMLETAIAYYEALDSGYQRVKSAEQICRAKRNKAAKIIGVTTDPQWTRSEKLLDSAQSEWAKEGMFAKTLDQLLEAGKYYDELMRRAATVSLNIYPAQAAVSFALMGDTNTIVFSGSADECSLLRILPNDYEVRVRCENYHFAKWVLRKNQLRSGGKDRFNFSLSPYDGKLLITSDVPAEVWQGEKLGNTGEWISLSAEKAIPIEIKAPGYRTEKLTARLSANESLEKSVKMTLATGSLRVYVQAIEHEFAPFMPTNGLLIVGFFAEFRGV